MKRSVASGRSPNITNTVAVCSLIDPLSFTLKRSDKIIRREMRMTSRSLRRNSVRRESKTLKSCLRLVLLDHDLWRDIFKTASKVKCEAWTREREKGKPLRVQDVSKICGMYSLANTSALQTEFPSSSSLFGCLEWHSQSCLCPLNPDGFHCYSTCVTTKEEPLKSGCGVFIKITPVFQDFIFRGKPQSTYMRAHRHTYTHICICEFSPAHQKS